jgi:ubiquinone/menaquinone biosynthesis C-methylase UbiE
MDTKPPSLRGAIESRDLERPAAEYRRMVRDHYDGAAGAFTKVTGFLTGHETLAGRLFRPDAFDVRGCRTLLDAGCGNGRYSVAMLRRADPGTRLAAFDFSFGMLGRSRRAVGEGRAWLASADVTRLPYASETFDAGVCGWVLEHLPDPRPALREFRRVLRPDGRFLLMCTEDTWTGAMCSRLWHCRTYNRHELKSACDECGLPVVRDHWFTPLHRRLNLGGVIIELRKS